jgi:hypothetical protein
MKAIEEDVHKIGASNVLVVTCSMESGVEFIGECSVEQNHT